MASVAALSRMIAYIDSVEYTEFRVSSEVTAIDYGLASYHKQVGRCDWEVCGRVFFHVVE